MKELEAILLQRFGKEAAACSNEELYAALLEWSQKLARAKESEAGKRKLYYISAEFLIGKLLSNNLINLGVYDEVRNFLARSGKQLSDIEECEPEPSLGNGGLGRLAACFLDSIATLGLAGDGVGLNYHLGLFRQTFANNHQAEQPNPWMETPGWLEDTHKGYTVQFGKFALRSHLYDIAVTGYHSRTNKLHLFDVDSVDESIVTQGIAFDKDEIAKNLTLFLYPDDSDEAGRKLRVYQQYFMVSNAAQLILEECEAKGSNLHDLAEYAVIQINDTHPTMVIPELIRLLTLRGIEPDEAVEIVRSVCAYTNHTILAEALEKWPLAYFEEVVPALVPILKMLDEKAKALYPAPQLAIIDADDRVHMAHIDIHYGKSVNGVAALHTEILKNNELAGFYKIYPEKFNNKTNGITFRRWLLHANPELTRLIEACIGDGFKTDAAELEKLLPFADDAAVQEALMSVKREKKRQLSQYLLDTQGIALNENAVFDIQIKRLHEYKRQQLNVLYVIRQYLAIKAGRTPAVPVNVIFGAKAAPAYVIAKDIIHIILCLQEIVNNDPQVSPWMKVVMVENYNVTKAEKLIPACDISEQISLASKEASGTGNMKFMLNGAVTLGTLDGANVEIHQLVGDDNIFLFGAHSEQVIEHYQKADYDPMAYYEADAELREAVDFLLSEEMLRVGDAQSLKRYHKELLGKDWFMTLLDYQSYCAARDKAINATLFKSSWARRMLVNIAKAGYFSSDRTIRQYNEDIWHL